MKHRPEIFIYTALACEAKPLVAHYRLNKESRIQPFNVYCNERVCLTVTGLGKHAMAAGVAYTQALYFGVENPILINLGIAGHRAEAVGAPFIGHKITDIDTGRKFYPVLAYSLPCASAAILTASIPQLNYDHQYLCDMEASAFYETAIRFSTGELIQCVKIVSDNQARPADSLDAKQVIDLIATNIDVLDLLMDELSRLVMPIIPEPDDRFEQLVRSCRFTVTEQSRLKKLLLTWQVLTDSRPLEIDTALGLRKGKDVLCWLERQIEAVEVTL